MKSMGYWSKWSPMYEGALEAASSELTKLTKPIRNPATMGFVSFGGMPNAAAPGLYPEAVPIKAVDCELIDSWLEDFNQWVIARCTYCDRWFTSISILNQDFNDWLLDQDQAPCSRSTFERLLNAADVLSADSLVNGLTIREDTRNLNAPTYEVWKRLMT